jgi:hypothetical protein
VKNLRVPSGTHPWAMNNIHLIVSSRQPEIDPIHSHARCSRLGAFDEIGFAVIGRQQV